MAKITYYTQETIYRTYTLDKQDSRKVLQKANSLKQCLGDYDEQVFLQQACFELIELGKISPCQIDDDGDGEEITSVEVFD